MSARAIKNNKTIEHEITNFVQSHWDQDEQAIDKYQSAKSLGTERAEANANKYGGLLPTQGNGHCSYFFFLSVNKVPLLHREQASKIAQR